MRINTKNFGNIEIIEENVITFEDGLPGFLDCKKFVKLKDDADSPFCWIQSLDNADLAFALIDPLSFYPSYAPSVPDEFLIKLGEIKEGVFEVYTILVILDDIKEMTANLKAPLIIHTETKKGMQAVVENIEYKVKHKVFEELEKLEHTHKDGE